MSRHSTSSDVTVPGQVTERRVTFSEFVRGGLLVRRYRPDLRWEGVVEDDSAQRPDDRVAGPTTVGDGRSVLLATTTGNV